MTAAVITTEIAIPEPVFVEPAEAEFIDMPTGTPIEAEFVDLGHVDGKGCVKDLVEVTATVIDTVLLTEAKARSLDKKIRSAGDKVASGFDTLLTLMEQATEGSIHLALGFVSLSAYFNEAIRIAPTDTDERQLMAGAMSGKGMSQRAIAKALGVSQSTVRDDLKDVSSDDSPGGEPAVTVGVDGKEYARPEKPAESDAEPVEKPRQAKALAAAVKAVTKVAEVLEDAFADTDNFDADVNPELIADTFKSIRAAASRINKVGRTLSSLT